MSSVNWLAVTPGSGQTPATVQLSLVAGNLPATGHHEGMVKVTSGGVTETARVFYRVVGSPNPSSQPGVPGGGPSAVQITPRSIEFSSTGGVMALPAVPVQLTSNTAGVSFSATRTTATGGPWLVLSASSGAVPGGFNATANPAGLAPGVYTGLITITLTGAVSEQRNIQVVLRVNAAGGVNPETPKLSLNRGGVTIHATRNAANPPSEQLNLEARGAASIPFQSVISIPWLTVTPATGTAPTNITLSANTAGLAAGVYNTTIFFQATGGTALSTSLNVVLTVANAAATASAQGGLHGLFLQPAQDFVSYADAPTPVTVKLFQADGTPVTGARVELAVSGDAPDFELIELSQGVYTGRLLSRAGGPVSLVASAYTVDGDVLQISTGGDVEGSVDPLPTVFPEGIVSTASFASGVTPVAPGAILSLFGTDLAEATASASAVPLPRSLAGVKVLVGGIKAPLISVNAGVDFDQINFQMPVEAATLSYADVVVLRNNAFSNSEGISIAPSVPSIFTQTQQGTGAAAALHSNFSLISAANPVRSGDTVLLYATGLGETTPDVSSGQVSLSRATSEVQILVGGVQARVSFAGIAPGFAGLYQVNFEMPAGVAPGDAAVQLNAGGIGSGEGITIAVR